MAFAIGASEDDKKWGADNFAALATALADQGYASIPLGGPAESRLIADIMVRVREDRRGKVHPLASRSVLESAAIIRGCHFLVGNDTGMLNVAAATETRSLGLFGLRAALEHDPTCLRPMDRAPLEKISVSDVMDRLAALEWLRGGNGS